MSSARARFGFFGETLAAYKLARLGYTLIERNYRCRHGEIDLVMQKGGVWVFVEVRAKRGHTFGTPEESVTTRKKQHLLATAQHYLHTHQLENVDWRIDFVAVVLNRAGQVERVDVIENAVN